MAFQTGLEDKPWWVSALLGLVFGIGLYYAGYYYMLKPKQAELADLEGELSTLQSKIQEGRAAKAQLPRFREEVRKLEIRLDRLLRVLPARRNTQELLRRVRALAEQGNFDLKRFTPGAEVDQDFYSEWPITINVEGTYHNLALFFDQIGRFSRVINIEGLRINAARPGSEHTIAANFRAKTFIYKEPEPDLDPEGGP